MLLDKSVAFHFFDLEDELSNLESEKAQKVIVLFLSGRELEGVNNLSSQILRRCFPTNKLPVSTLSSPLAFALLDLDSAGHSAAEDLLDDSGEGEV